MRKSLLVYVAAVCWVSSTAGAAFWQEPATPQTPVPPAAQAPAGGAAATGSETPSDPEAIKRGRTVFLENCVACHGQDATGGPMGEKTDLTRSIVVKDDVGGKQFGDFLAEGRPEAQMPPMALDPKQVKDLAAYLHSISVLKPTGGKPGQP